MSIAPVGGSDTDASRTTTWQRAVVRARRWQLVRVAAVALATLVVGAAIGRLTAPEADPDVRATAERVLEPFALDADGIWTSVETDGRPPVSEAIPMVRRGEQLERIGAWSDEWLQDYHDLLVRLTIAELPPAARPAQRQFVLAVTLSRDAVEVLGHAARTVDPEARETLVAEALRLRQRAEHATQSARASVRDLAGGDGEVSPYPVLPGLDERPQPAGA